MQEFCEERARRFHVLMRKRWQHDKELCARYAGFRVHDYVKQEYGNRYESSSPIYRRARRTLDAKVRSGELCAYKPGANAYVFYWPTDLSMPLD